MPPDDLAQVIDHFMGLQVALLNEPVVRLPFEVHVHRVRNASAVQQLREIFGVPALSDSPASDHGQMTFTREGFRRLSIAAVVLHTDIAIMNDVGSVKPDVGVTLPQASLHFGIALHLVDCWRAFSPHDPLVRAWYVGVAAFLQSRQEIVSTPLFLDQALSRLPGNVDLLLLAGACQELLASARVQEGARYEPGFSRLAVRSAADHLRAAERFYRAAVVAAEHSTEARLRLAHVLGDLQRHDEALSTLNGPVQEPDRVLRYFAYLCTGREYEALRRLEPAEDAYKRAIALFPGARSAYLALAYCAGQRSDATAAIVLEQMLAVRAEFDPWDDYYSAGPARDVPPLLDALRRMVGSVD
jgi:tetratricopeptide (TPR) repeat protein